jgi:hypothetical protein
MRQSRLPRPTPSIFKSRHIHCCLLYDTSVPSLNTDLSQNLQEPFTRTRRLSLCFGVSTTTIAILSQCYQRHTHPDMDNLLSLPYHSRKRNRDAAPDSSLFLFPHPKRANHNNYRPQSNSNRSSPSTESAEAMTRSLSPNGGVAIDEKALAGLREHRHVVLSCDDDSSDDDDSSSDDNSSDDSSSDEGSQDEHLPLGRLSRPSHLAEPLQRRTGRHRPLYGSSHHHNTSNDDQKANMPYTSPLPVSNHQRGKFKLDPCVSTI